jgi:hypothetical protein
MDGAGAPLWITVSSPGCRFCGNWGIIFGTAIAGKGCHAARLAFAFFRDTRSGFCSTIMTVLIAHPVAVATSLCVRALFFKNGSAAHAEISMEDLGTHKRPPGRRYEDG